MTFAERHGIPPIGSGLSLGHILYLQLDRPEVHAATAAYLEAMDYVTARLTGRIAASQHTSFMVQCCDNRTLGATEYDDELVEARGRRRDTTPAARARSTRRSDRCDPTSRPRSGCPRGRSCTRRRTTRRPSRSRPAHFSAGRAGLAIGTTSVLVDGVADFRTDLEHQILSMPGPEVDRYVVCAENGLGGKVVEHVLERSCYALDALGDHRVDERSRSSTPRWARPTPAGRRRDVPAVAQRLAGADRERIDPRRLRQHVARD